MVDWFDSPLVALDVETTGIAETDSVVEIACVVVERRRVVFERAVLLNPGIPMPEAASKVHGITDELLAECKRFADVAEHVDSRIRSGQPVAYNAPFDRRMIGLELERCGRVIGSGPWIDPLVWVQKIDKYERGKKLTDACRRRGIKISAHRALGDARATLSLLFALRKHMPADPSELLFEQATLAGEQETERQAWRAAHPRLEATT